MGLVSYLDDNTMMSRCFLNRNYDLIKDRILKEKGTLDTVFFQDNELFGFQVDINEPLTQLYGFTCYVVKFVFSSVDTLHAEQQELCMNKVCIMLANWMEHNAGYYNIRLPSHIVDLIKAFNKHITKAMFCGGTVEQVHIGDVGSYLINPELNLFFADKSYINEHRNQIEKLAYDSFANYQGQYHISPIMDYKAGVIYQNWITQFLNACESNTVLIGEYNERVVGFFTIREVDFVIDGVLGAVDSSARNLGVYRAMLSTLMKYAKEKNKLFVSSTQFDNFIVQGTWASMGMRPFYSIFNFHNDNR